MNIELFNHFLPILVLTSNSDTDISYNQSRPYSLVIVLGPLSLREIHIFPHSICFPKYSESVFRNEFSRLPSSIFSILALPAL